MTVSYQPFIPFDENFWIQIRDGNPWANDLFSRHYSKYFYKDGRKVSRFVGPGERLVLISRDGNALFVWRKFISKDDQTGINCAIFRNEGKELSSRLILLAEQLAAQRWPNETRLYTYINAAKIASKNPGYCFKCAGWRFLKLTKRRNLHILVKTLIPRGSTN